MVVGYVLPDGRFRIPEEELEAMLRRTNANEEVSQTK